jgi:hypothetical protein
MLSNDYFHSPDAEILYTLIRTQKPARIIEIGSGNSTKIARQAIRDRKLNTQLLSIDPQPRTEIDALADECVRCPVEQADPALFDTLHERGILFIDSSHEIRVGNDSAFLYSTVLARLAPGVTVNGSERVRVFEHIESEFRGTRRPAAAFRVARPTTRTGRWLSCWIVYHYGHITDSGDQTRGSAP